MRDMALEMIPTVDGSGLTKGYQKGRAPNDQSDSVSAETVPSHEKLTAVRSP